MYQNKLTRTRTQINFLMSKVRQHSNISSLQVQYSTRCSMVENRKRTANLRNVSPNALEALEALTSPTLLAPW